MNSLFLKKPVRWASLLAFALVLAFAQQSCKKDNTENGNGSTTMRMYLTDAPGDYQAIYLNIQAVEVTGIGGVKNLNLVRPGIYNLLDFRNGLDTLLGDVILPAGTVSQIRLILGDGNSIMVDGQTYPLSTPSAQQSGLKLNVHAELVAGITYDMWIDFDASRSIVKKGNGDYSLKPVIRAFTKALTGGIKGSITLPGNATTVYAIQNTDTVGTLADSLTGKFLIGGLNPGSYKVFFKGNGTHPNREDVGVIVNIGVVTDMGIVVIP